jgi:sulfur carrier protein ThiS
MRGSNSMVTVRFLHLLRSKYKLHTFELKPGTINDIILQLKDLLDNFDMKDFEQAVVFVNTDKVIHPSRFDELVNDGDDVVFTHFVGGG